jgi:hypothetical protein
MPFDFDRLRAQIAGEIFEPGDAGYDEMRALWNGGIDRWPAGIAICADTADVAQCLQSATNAGVEVSVLVIDYDASSTPP